MRYYNTNRRTSLSQYNYNYECSVTSNTNFLIVFLTAIFKAFMTSFKGVDVTHLYSPVFLFKRRLAQHNQRPKLNAYSFSAIEFGQDLVEGAVSEGSELMSPNTITV